MKIVRRKPIDNTIERQIITGMIISKSFLKEIYPIYNPEMLQLEYARTVASWCMNYFSLYDDAPQENIEDIFQEHKKTDLNPDQANLIEEFLMSISNEYERSETFNALYIADKTEKHFRQSHLQNTKRELTKLISSNKIEEAEALINSFVRVTRPESQGVDSIRDKNAIREALSEETGDQLFHLPGDLGRIMGRPERGFLWAVVGASGVGKTWWLWFLSQLAVFAGYNSPFYSLEMSKKQMTKRIQMSLNAKPLKKHEGKILLPVFDCIKNQDNSCNRADRMCEIGLLEPDGSKPDFYKVPHQYKPCTYCRGKWDYECGTWWEEETKEGIKPAIALKKRNQMDNMLKKMGKFNLQEYPSGTLTMSMLKANLYNLEKYENLISDVIATDYADKCCPERNVGRDGINEVWEGHKGLAQETHTLVLSGSQSNTARTGKDIKQGDWADDIRKLNLVDGAFALNQTPLEKREGVLRVGMLKQRHDEFDVLGEVVVLQSLKIGRPYLDSCYIPYKPKKEEK